jgi:lipopolysaccharide/colanic/teichoic acid biosynthesis glycosyltransferase
MNNKIETKYGPSRPFDFFVLLGSWFIFGCLFHSVKTPNGFYYMSWVLLTSSLSMISLNGIGYFEEHSPKPGVSGVLILFAVLTFSVCCSKWVLSLITHEPPLRYFEAARASAWVAAVFAVSQWLIYKVHQATNRTWSLATFLLPEEEEALRDQIAESGLSEWIKVHPCKFFDHNGGAPREDETLVISRGATRDLNGSVELLAAHLRGQRIVDVRQLLKEFRGRVHLGTADAWSFLMGSKYQSPAIRFYFYLKGFLEPLLVLILMVLISPLYLALALGVYLANGRPILYRQERLGYRGQRIQIYKFRTMATTAEEEGPQWARDDDPRVTPFGRFLRRSRLDELPQLINVFRGELSFVGPRPERPEFYPILSTQIPLFPLRLMVRPGVTGWAQVKHGYAGSIDESRTKLEYDLYYIQNMSPQLDLQVLANTAALVFRGGSGR